MTGGKKTKADTGSAFGEDSVKIHHPGEYGERGSRVCEPIGRLHAITENMFEASVRHRRSSSKKEKIVP